MVKLLVGILINRITWEVKQLIAEFEKNQIKYELLNNQKVYSSIISLQRIYRIRISTNSNISYQYSILSLNLKQYLKIS